MKSLAEQAIKTIETRPHIKDIFYHKTVNMCIAEMAARGCFANRKDKYLSFRHVWQTIRHEYGYKINDHDSSYIGRMFLNDHPEYDHLFIKKNLKG